MHKCLAHSMHYMLTVIRGEMIGTDHGQWGPREGLPHGKCRSRGCALVRGGHRGQWLNQRDNLEKGAVALSLKNRLQEGCHQIEAS